jgi:hypothetical protein
MAVAMLIDNQNGSQEIYEQLRERIGLDKPAGGIFHVAGPSPNGGWRVIEIWESEEDAKRFLAEGPSAGRGGDRRRAATTTRALARPQLHDGVVVSRICDEAVEGHRNVHKDQVGSRDGSCCGLVTEPQCLASGRVDAANVGSPIQETSPPVRKRPAQMSMLVPNPRSRAAGLSAMS